MNKSGRNRARNSFNLRQRLKWVGLALGLCSVSLVGRAAYVQIINSEFYQRQGRRIAKAIVARRDKQPFTRTAELAELIASVMPRGKDKIHPATRSFQAIRIHINRELADLEAGLDAAMARLKPGGRLAVISFHSLEDRIVKQFMNRHAKAPPSNRRLPELAAFVPTLDLHGGAIKAEDDELAVNPRSRSAVLRVAEKREVAG